jgi:hypothetical protein
MNNVTIIPGGFTIMKRALVFLTAAALIAALSFASGPQEKKPASKYDAYCGEYQFDLTSLGAGTITAKVYVENDALFIWASTSDSQDQLSPVENEPAKFFIDDPDEGHWDFEFLKDDKGKFSKCRIINTGMGVDTVGEKIGG